MTELQLTRPDDFHCHFRDGDGLATTVKDSAATFGRVLAMPNLVPPVDTVKDALAYRERILSHNSHPWFHPVMTLYFTPTLTADEIEKAAKHADVVGVKLYPAGATTHSDAGVGDIESLYPMLEVMQANNLPLLIHGEVTWPESDIFDREQLFIDHYLQPIMQNFPRLKIVLEHITTAYAVNFIQQADHPIAATITAHHLLINRNDLLVGGIKPHHYCLPVAKRSTDQQALLNAATSGSDRFFLGSDSAPHVVEAKQSACGCAGIYTAHQLLAYYVMAFESVDKLDKLENFASQFGAAFYQLEPNTDKVTLKREPYPVPESLPFAHSQVVPLFAGKTLPWTVVS